MIKNKPLSSKDHLKRFLQKNKTLKIDSNQDNDKRKQIENKKKKTSPKCSFIQCSPLIDKQKSQHVKENKLYKRILLTEDSQNNSILMEKNFQQLRTKKYQLNVVQNNYEPKQQQRFNKSANNPSILFQKSSINFNFNFNTITNNSLSSSSNHIIEDLSKENNNRIIKNTCPTETFNSTTTTSPLQIWKQLDKQYRKNNSTIYLDCIKKQQKRRQKQQTSHNVQAVDQFIKQYINKNKHKHKHKIDQTKTDQNRQQQQQLQTNIILRRSFSCDEFEKSKIIKYDNKFIQQQERGGNLLACTQSIPRIYRLSPKTSKNNSILLLHKQPLQKYIQKYFNPVTNNLSNQKQQNQHLSKVINKQISIRIKAKRLTQRNVQKLDRIKNDLFKQTKQNIMRRKRNKKMDACNQMCDNSSMLVHKQSQNQFSSGRTSNKIMVNSKREMQSRWPKYQRFLKSTIKTKQKQILSKRRTSGQQKQFKNNKTRQFVNGLHSKGAQNILASQQQNKENKQNNNNPSNRPQLQLIRLKLPLTINNKNQTHIQSKQQKETKMSQKNSNNNNIKTPTITTPRSSVISFGDCQSNYYEQTHINKAKTGSFFFNAW